MATQPKLSSHVFLLATFLLVPKFIHKNNWYCFTPIASFIVDTPEAAMLEAVGGKTSPIMMATYKQFTSKADPSDIEIYFHKVQKFHLNGVNKPFCRFLTLEILHHIHKDFGNHNVKWCINALGPAKINFRFSVLQPITGLHHFKEGISTLKQVMGRTLHDIQHFIVGVSARDIETIHSALHQFHLHKHSILDAGLCHGKANKPIDNWHTPKLKLMQSVVPSITRVGVSIQWSADLTKHACIKQIKDPA
ncbi:hypothetical protein EDC04DRAFT_2603194 [Pisolithus marmoratus]|nr:hypothetical protein EDC04DRAFT_2603194 [Pisolithus marmoratus]